MVDQSVKISVTNVNVQTHQLSVTTFAALTFKWGIITAMELKTKLGNTSTNLTVLEDLMNCFAGIVSNVMPLARSALMFCKCVTEKQTAIIIPMKIISLQLQGFLVCFLQHRNDSKRQHKV